MTTDPEKQPDEVASVKATDFLTIIDLEDGEVILDTGISGQHYGNTDAREH